MQAVIDRVEEKFVVLKLDDGQEIKVDSKWIINGGEKKEGSVVDILFKIRPDQTRRRRLAVEKLLKRALKIESIS